MALYISANITMIYVGNAGRAVVQGLWATALCLRRVASQSPSHCNISSHSLLAKLVNCISFNLNLVFQFNSFIFWVFQIDQELLCNLTHIYL